MGFPTIVIPALNQPRLAAALAHARRELLAARGDTGHWTGELSSSALSTATAVTALAVTARESGRPAAFSERIASGLEWLARHANADGGWGDTPVSRSNLSTTTLCWAAFGAAPGADARHRETVSRAEEWLRAHAGGLDPDRLAPAIIARYGKDRTFSVPILTLCALAGRLGTGRDAWRHVIPLPFELALCPHSWFAALRLPVVSYALPALIAIGQARHHYAPSRNPPVRLARAAARRRSLAVLERLQPRNGGFLEATPLTSFVTMSLAGSGQVEHAVTRRGLAFLEASQRPDGSWPIDTNLATWLSTLAVNALWTAGEAPGDDVSELRRWLLAQQHRVVHPYTHAAPGGWAWTDLPGGVPDADDTAGMLLALHRLGPLDEAARAAGLAGARWLMGLQNADGGIPTFCRGWGALPFDRSSADITAHVVRAWLEWRAEAAAEGDDRLRRAIRRALAFLVGAQRKDGCWVPLWFGNERVPDDENPVYGTARVLPALVQVGETLPETARLLSEALARGTRWLTAAQNPDGSWGGAVGVPGSIEETALAVEALATVLGSRQLAANLGAERLAAAAAAGTNWLMTRVESGEWTTPAPIGFYFARLWYYERLYPLVFTTGALTQIARWVAKAG